MTALEITAKEFQEKQKSFFEIADTGRQIIIKKGRKQAYSLAPVEEDGFVVTPEIMERIEKSRQQFREGRVTVCKTRDEILRHLESL
ncbi:MAG: hypothetical protein LBK96_03845 [Prevotellaceae bacterium]|jgi:hypothetical protein|nr:hypothetical protein [Prevotellaceae bacterium]